MTQTPTKEAVQERLELGRRFTQEILQPMKESFVEKDEIIDLLGVSLVGSENLFILGPPGTAKSALVHELGRRLHGKTFSYLLTRFTEPNEIFGPFDIRKLREGDLVTNTDGMLPEASLVFLDELLNANSAILNSLLTVLNERAFRRGREWMRLPTLMVVGASNHLPQDTALAALFDRFLLRVVCENVPEDHLADVLQAGWRLEGALTQDPPMSIDEIRAVGELLPQVDLAEVGEAYLDLVRQLRHAGIPVSDRRAVKLQRVVASSALLCGRMAAQTSDLWVLRYIWDTEEQREVIASLVDSVLQKSEERADDHPRARGGTGPDPDSMAQAITEIETSLERLASAPTDRTDGPVGSSEDGTGADVASRRADEAAVERSVLRDRLGVLASRCQWVKPAESRSFLLERVDKLWERLGR